MSDDQLSHTPAPGRTRVFGVEVKEPPEGVMVTEVMVIAKTYGPESSHPTYVLLSSAGWTWAERVGTLAIYHDSSLAQVNKADYQL